MESRETARVEQQGERGRWVGSSYKERIEWKEKRDKGEARTERREGCLLADQSIGKYRHRGESRRRDTQDGREGRRQTREKASEKDEEYEGAQRG